MGSSSKELEIELQRLKEQEIKYEIELKLKDKKIDELKKENEDLIASKHQMQIDHNLFLETIKEENRAEVEKVASRHLMQQSIQIDQLMNSEKDEKLKDMKSEIKRLEKMNERENAMFEKQFQIMTHKSERDKIEKNELKEKVQHLQDLYEEEVRDLNDVIIQLKQEMFQLSNMNIIIEERLNSLVLEKEEQEKNDSNIQSMEVMERQLQEMEDSKVIL